ncbi:hypothetical protein VHEMI03306 [[Torrubiella] hemipterigena]|uniref:Serum paraoxonase/arylesterase family protein n=1 Tax=[Torrubiella] hemipterigena TaxID=1531966 RepID=A0A0A1TD22_9HYPO|nr:hypothetical protein VHEMI03306 [[Torrubiella] hemipterigena]
MSSIFSFRRMATAVGLTAILAYQYGAPIHRGVVIFGLLRGASNTVVADGDLVVIEGTKHCEDIHHHEPSQSLFLACEGANSPRRDWFPPLSIYTSIERGNEAQAEFRVIDTTTMKSKPLNLVDFSGPFISHGIDVLEDPQQPLGKAVYLFAVNHKPDAAHWGPNGSPEANKSRSVIEVFHHVIGSNTAEHLRTIWHPLIRTPNDIHALSPTSFLITNDHYHREGPKRALEDLYFYAQWTETVRIEFDPKDKSTDAAGVRGHVVLDNMHNNNGIGRGRTDNEFAVVSAASGRLRLATLSAADAEPKAVINEVVSLDSTLDNPSYFADPYYTATDDKSGFVLAGLRNAYTIEKAREHDHVMGSMVWKATPVPGKTADSPVTWEKRLLFEDDGQRIPFATAALIVGIDPKKEGGKRKGWLYITGLMAENAVAVKIDL